MEHAKLFAKESILRRLSSCLKSFQNFRSLQLHFEILNFKSIVKMNPPLNKSYETSLNVVIIGESKTLVTTQREHDAFVKKCWIVKV